MDAREMARGLYSSADIFPDGILPSQHRNSMHCQASTGKTTFEDVEISVASYEIYLLGCHFKVKLFLALCRTWKSTIHQGPHSMPKGK